LQKVLRKKFLSNLPGKTFSANNGNTEQDFQDSARTAWHKPESVVGNRTEQRKILK